MPDGDTILLELAGAGVKAGAGAGAGAGVGVGAGAAFGGLRDLPRASMVGACEGGGLSGTLIFLNVSEFVVEEAGEEAKEVLVDESLAALAFSFIACIFALMAAIFSAVYFAFCAILNKD
jgi:hypothetical protein